MSDNIKIAGSPSLDAVSVFKDEFHKSPEWIAAAPGRVNLIGEHTDYNLLPVLPMSIDRSIRVYGATRSDSIVRLANTNNSFPAGEIDLGSEIKSIPGHWTNYAGAAFNAIVPIIRELRGQINGYDAIIESDLPPAAGLSSSSALVIASCMALLHANNVTWPMTEVADRMRRAERFVGTAGGGMDHAAISLGRAGSALLIEFDPLRTIPVTVPQSTCIFVINSGQKTEKTGAMRFSFNRRALECAIAVELLRKSLAGKMDTSSWSTLRDVFRACGEKPSFCSEAIVECLPADPLSLNQLLKLIDHQTLHDLCRARQLDLQHVDEWLPGGTFQVYARAAHVLNEASRVYRFKQALEQDCLVDLWDLANASHASCRDLYHISTPQVERLIATATACGAGAARITGAGFGGCIVAFVPTELASDFPRKLEEAGICSRNIIPVKSPGPASISTVPIA